MLRQAGFTGMQIEGVIEKVIASLFADDTTVYLDEDDSFEDLKKVLDKWCKGSSAKFNVGKTGLIPIGCEEYRDKVIETCRMNDHSLIIPDEVQIVKEGKSIRILGARVGNQADQDEIWTPIIGKIDTSLERCQRLHQTLEAKRFMTQLIIAGRTQYATCVSGMPKAVEERIARMQKNFIWETKAPPINVGTITAPISQGGKKMLNISIRNEAINLKRLLTYLRDDPDRPAWAFIADTLIRNHRLKVRATEDPITCSNMFLESWRANIQNLPPLLKSMIHTAELYGVKFMDVKPSRTTQLKMSAWTH
ncbi:hypothetical protein C8J56DRAFT_804032, partial [Mycena floridula]